MLTIKGTVKQRSATDSKLAYIMPDVEVYGIDTQTGEKLFGPVKTNENGFYQVESNFADRIEASRARYSMVAKATGQGKEPCYGTLTQSNVLSSTPNSSGGTNNKLVNTNGFNLLFEPDVCQSEVPVSDQELSTTESESRTSKTSKGKMAIILVGLALVGFFAYKSFKK
tara:strand:- start:12001 stop:12507 length:507 start_codon:yes stop_codon:yes gene_type:complete